MGDDLFFFKKKRKYSAPSFSDLFAKLPLVL